MGSPSCPRTRAVTVAAEAAEGERDAAGDRIRVERRLVDRRGPVALRRLHGGAPAVLDRRVERTLTVDRGVEVVDRLGQTSRSTPMRAARSSTVPATSTETPGMSYSSVRSSGRSPAVVDLEGDRAGLLEDGLAVLGVRVVPEVGALVDEPLPVAVDDDAEGIALPGEPVGQLAVALVARVPGIPLHAVRARPVATLGRPDPQGGGDHVAGVVRRATDLGVLPARRRGTSCASTGSASKPPAARIDRLGRATALGPSAVCPATPATRPSSTIRSGGGGRVAHVDAEPFGHLGVVGHQALRRRRRCRCAGRRRRGSCRPDARTPGVRTAGGTAARGGAATAPSPGPRSPAPRSARDRCAPPDTLARSAAYSCDGYGGTSVLAMPLVGLDDGEQIVEATVVDAGRAGGVEAVPAGRGGRRPSPARPCGVLARRPRGPR